MRSRTLKILLTVAIFFGGGGMLIYSSMAEAEYYKHVHEVTPELEKWADKTVKIHGFVEAGSIVEEIVDQATVREFILESEGERILVKNRGPKPDTFKDLAEVVAKGRLVKEGDSYVLHASELMAKCPSKYEENQRSRQYGESPEPNLERPNAVGAAGQAPSFEASPTAP